MAEFIQKTDTLNEGREKLNAAIQDAEDAKTIAGQAVNTSNEAKQIAQTAENKADNVQEQFNQVVIEGDSSVEAAQARVDAENNTFSTLKERLDTKEVQFTAQLAQILNEVHSLDNIKINRSEAATKQELSQMIDNTEQYINNQLNQIGSMTPRGAYATLLDLENAFPNGAEGVYLVQDNGHWYFWNGTEWVDGGIYQALPWDEFMTVQDEEWVI